MIVNLTDRTVRAARPRIRQFEVADSKATGLSLRVLPSGSKTWSYRFRRGTGWGRVSLGPWPAVSLADAREAATEHLRSLKLDGLDPAAAKRARRERLTFAELAELYIQKHAKPRKRSWKDDRRKLEADVLPAWRNLPAAEITRGNVRDVVEVVASRGASIQANRIRALLSKIFAFAVERELVPFNPVVGTPRPGVEHQRQRVLTEEEIRTFWQATEEMEPAMSAFWRLRLVTAQRAVEVNTMRWSDLDLENSLWTIPGERSKNKLAHRVPLSATALEIIGELHRIDDYVLAGARGNRQQSKAGQSIPLEDFRGHDLRRTAASLMASGGIPRLHIGKVLNHAEQGITAVYDRHGYDPEKRVALDTWERKLRAIIEQTDGAEVVPFVARG